MIGVFLSILSNTILSNAGQIDTSKCLDDGKDCGCDTAPEVVECKAKIPAAEKNAQIKSLFGYPPNRVIANNNANKDYCKNPNKCTAYLATLKTIESEYQACQYAKKKIKKAHETKVREHMGFIGMKAGGTLETHMRNRQSDELRWLICNYIVACEQGVTFLGQETNSLCN